MIENVVNVNAAWNGWLDLIEQFMSATILRVKVKPNRSHSWVDSEIRHLNHINMTAWRRAKRSAKCSVWNKFKKLRKQLKKRMKHKYHAFVEDLSDKVKTNPKTFWSFFHDKTQSKAIPDTLTDSDSEYTEPAAKTNLFNNYFQSVFAKDQSPTRCNADNVRPAEINLSSIKFYYLKVQKNLSRLDPNKAYGPDNLSSSIRKECANVLAQSLTLLLKRVLPLVTYQPSGNKQMLYQFTRRETNHKFQTTDQSHFYA